MKQRLNILCAIVLVVMSYSVLEAGYYFMSGMIDGLTSVANEVSNVKEGEIIHAQDIMPALDYQYVHLVPEDGLAYSKNFFTDSVHNELDGKKVPVSYSALILGLDGKQMNLPMTGLIGIFSLAHFAFSVWSFLLFISLVRSINHSDIFSWKNVRRLRLLGLALLLSFLFNMLYTGLTYVEVENRFALEGYKLNYTEVIDTMTCVLGLCAFIVAEVFAIGLRMKEEQELTI